MPAARHLVVLPLILATSTGVAAGLDFRAVVAGFLAQQTRGTAGTVSIEVPERGIPRQPRECPAPEAFFPAGNRAWGRTTVGVRCRQPAWTLYVPARVRVERPYLAASRPLAAGAVLSAADWQTLQGDVAALPAGVLTDAAGLAGRTLRLPVAAGAPLRSDQLLTQMVVRRGETVRVVIRDGGVEASNAGTALANAAEGQSVQVRVGQHRTVQGIARAGGWVEVLR